MNKCVLYTTANFQNCKFGFVTHLFAAEVTKNLQGQCAFGCPCDQDDKLVFSYHTADGSPKGQMCRLTPSFIQHARSTNLQVVSAKRGVT